MDRLYNVIKKITEFPELYIGKPSLDRLYAFICGFLFQNSMVNDQCLDGFTEYVAQRYGVCSDYNWSSIIQSVSVSERDAFLLFIQLFDEFTARH